MAATDRKEGVVEIAKSYVEYEPNASYREHVSRAIEKDDIEELVSLMLPRISFGTSGLRSRMAPGYAHMNELTVLQTTQGLSVFLRSQHRQTSQGLSVVIGFDHRHNSETFARVAASVFLPNDIKVLMLEKRSITPLVPFAVSHYKVHAGVMITASHNPAQDNGYKLYGSNGCAITSPTDSQIQSAILSHLMPKDRVQEPLQGHDEFEEISDDCSSAYYKYLEASLSKPSNIRFVYSPLHGVGQSFILGGLENSNFKQFLIPVPSQQHPDPSFPTLRFPNPEESGTFDESIKVAEQNSVNLILVNDPDADRFDIAERQINGKWKVFNGNELAAIFASFIFDQWKEAGKDISKCAMVSTIVSSRAIAVMAEREGFRHEACLTGFKWIGNRAYQLTKEGFDVGFCFEEAIGFMFGSQVLDKDGIHAACKFLQLYDSIVAKDLTATSYLQHFYQRYGYFESRNSYFVCQDSSHGKKVINQVLRADGKYPQKINGQNVDRVLDATLGYDSARKDHNSTIAPTPDAEMVCFYLDNGRLSISVRGSGTESKIKYYIEGSGSTQSEAMDLAKAAEHAIIDLFKLPDNNLKLPFTG